MTETQPGFVDQVKSYPAAFWVANTMEIFERMAWYGFYAVAALYITGPVETGALGFTTEQKGAILAIVPFFLYLFPVITGALADRYGYKKMFIIAYLMMIVCYYALGSFKGFWPFLGAFMFVAVAAAIFKPVVVGTVARVTNEKNSSTGFGIFYMMVNIGGFAGPLVAGIIRGASWNYVFIACAGWALVNLLIVLFFYKDPTTEAGSAGARSLKQVLDNAVEVLGNLRFFVTVFVVLIALIVAGLSKPWFTWTHCIIFIVAWLVINFVYDRMLPRGSGQPVFLGGEKRHPFARRMFCSNWRFALFLLIMSGFWTSFNQIFITMPEYIRDFVDTRPMVSVGRKLFGVVGKDRWIDNLAAVEEVELHEEFDRLVRKARGAESMVPPEKDEKKPEAEAAEKEKKDRLREVFIDRNLTPHAVTEIGRIAAELSKPEAKEPLVAADLIDGARKLLQYKTRITASELGGLMQKIPDRLKEVKKEHLDHAVTALNTRLDKKGKPKFEGAEEQALRTALRTALARDGPVVSRKTLATACTTLSSGGRVVKPADIAVGIRDAAYRPFIWERVNQGRQVNPEHIINFDALAIVLLQVLVSFLMARYHRFTTMIVGMVVAAVGIGLSALAGGTSIGVEGGLLLVVVTGIVIFAVGEMMASPTSQEYVGRIAPRDKVALYMGYYFVAIALGNLFGGLLSGQFYGWLARDLQRPDLMWLSFGGLMLLTAVVFVLYNIFALPKHASEGLTPDQAS